MKKKILIVEDNIDLANLVKLHLEDIDCTSDIATDGGQGLKLYRKNTYDLVLLDIMLPIMDGISLCRKFRENGAYIPIIMLTSKSSEIDRVVGLEVGADDYMTKPFSIPELLARVKARFRAGEALSKLAEDGPTEIIVEGMTINLENRKVSLNDGDVALTAREFDLLVHFAKYPGRVYTRTQLLDQVWGYQFEGYEHTVNTHINRLRLKIEQDPSKPDFIQTVWGVGYKFGGLV
ncbi:MAG: response regulator transcription factor [Ghiorsea sp.]